MNLFKTNYSDSVDIHKIIYFQKKNDNFVATQYDSRGVFQDTIKLDIEAEEFIVDKKQFQQVISIAKNPTFKISDSFLTIIDNKDKFKLSLMPNVVIPKFEDVDILQAKSLPKDFVDKFKNAAKFGSIDQNKMMTRMVEIDGNKIRATDRYRMASFTLEEDIKDKFMLPFDTLQFFDKPTAYIKRDDFVYLTAENKLAKLFIVNGEFPNLEKAFEAQEKEVVKTEFDYKEAYATLLKANKLGIKIICISHNKIYSEERELVSNIISEVEIGNKDTFIKLNLEFLISAVSIKDDLNMYVNNEKSIILSNDTTKILIAANRGSSY